VEGVQIGKKQEKQFESDFILFYLVKKSRFKIDFTVPLSYGFWRREFVRDPSKNLMNRTILFFARGNSGYRFVARSMNLDRNPTMSNQRILPCPPAGRYKIFSSIPDEFLKVRVSS